jgi:hypothetical protein
MKLVEFIKNILDSILSGSFERLNIINEMNSAFRECFYSGELQRLCKVTISSGESSFRHEMSAIVFRSGFKITIENDNNLRESELVEISKYILSNIAFVRQLMAIGFDTLIIKGKTTLMGKKYSLKEYANLNNYFLKD